MRVPKNQLERLKSRPLPKGKRLSSMTRLEDGSVQVTYKPQTDAEKARAAGFDPKRSFHRQTHPSKPRRGKVSVSQVLHQINSYFWCNPDIPRNAERIKEEIQEEIQRNKRAGLKMATHDIDLMVLAVMLFFHDGHNPTEYAQKHLWKL